jgi:fibronectin-binding autotransporter adhesin
VDPDLFAYTMIYNMNTTRSNQPMETLMSVRNTISKIALATFGLATLATASHAQSDVKAEINFLNGSKDFKALLKAEPTLSADRTLLLPDANGTLMLNANPGIGGTGMLYGVTGPQNTALVSTYLFNVQYVAGAGAATGALITSASTGADAMGLDVVATAGAGTATALRLASSGGTTNYALDVVSGGIRIQSTLPTTTTASNFLVLEGGLVKTQTITTVDAGTTNNTTLRWDAGTSKWAENTNVLATSAGDVTLNSATIKATTNQLVLGTTNTTTISATAPAASRTYTLPDVGANASFVMTEGTQTINGDKTLSGATSLTGVATAKAGVAIRYENPAGTFSTGFKAGAQTADLTYTLPTAAATGNQVLRANSTTPTNLEWATITSVDAGTTNNTTLRWDAGTSKWAENTNVLATSAGDMTLNSATIKATTNQLVLGTTNTITISATAPAASSVYTIPDVGTTASFVMTAGAQTIAGAKTLSNALTITPTSNQLVLGTTNTTTINAVAPAASVTYTIPDAGANASFVMTEGTQTINGDKTLSGATSLTGVATAKAGNAIRFENTGGTAYTGFNAAAGQASNISYTLPAVAATANQVLRANSTTPTNLEWATLTTVDAGTTTDATIRWNGTKWVENTNVLATSTGDVTLNTVTAKATTNQLVLGTTNTTTISATAPAASRTYTLPDVGANASFVMTEGAQTINGAKTLSSALTITPATNQIVLGTTNTTTISATAPAASVTYTIPDVGANASFVMTEGAQTINGDKTLSGATTLSGTTSISGAATIKNTSVLEPTTAASIAGSTGGTIAVAATFVKQTVTANTGAGVSNVDLPAGTADGQILCLRLNVTNATGTKKISLRNSNSSVIETINTVDTKRFYQLMYSTADTQWMILSSQVIN